MLRRFQLIQRVGCFINSHPASVQFEPLSFVYGENCYGKSTLCDIIRSIAENNAEYVTHRKSIPNPDNSAQRVQLSVMVPGQANEQAILFSQNGWAPCLPPELRIFVFDTDFIHRNVFTGLSIERQNQENITQFVLDEGSVRTAERIAQQNSRLRALNKTLRELESTAFEGLRDIISFIQLQITKTPKEIQRDIVDLNAELKSQRNLAQNLDQALIRAVPDPIGMATNIEDFVKEVNTTLQASIQQAHEEASIRVREHIQLRTQANQTTETWIQSGIGQVKEDSCPFCGQKLSAGSLMLFADYKEFFDDAFDRLVNSTTRSLKVHEETFRALSLSYILERIALNTNAYIKYPELMREESYRNQVQDSDSIAAELRSALDKWLKEYREAGTDLASKFEQKRQALHLAIDSWECLKAIEAYDELRTIASRYDERVSELAKRIKEFKEGLNIAQIDNQISEIERQLSESRLSLRRAHSDTACEKYLLTSTEKQEIDAEIQTLNEQLGNEQNIFIEQYFNEINNIFAQLGSQKFTISKRISQRGNMPTIQLVASFAGSEITPERIKSFFSESDRRALALSVFWSKVQILLDQEKKQTILVLDDPVTSFDDGRIDRTIRLLEKERPKFRQMIILSHYTRYLKAFFDRSSTNITGTQLIKIEQDTIGSQLRSCTPTDFIESPHERMYRHIDGFIGRRHMDDISRDLRVFLETEVRSRFLHQIRANSMESLQFGELLDNLLRLGAVTPAQRAEIEQFRLSLNPEHHTWMERSQEEKIALSTDVIRYIYEEL